MTIDTARLRALAEAATPGPWEADDHGFWRWTDEAARQGEYVLCAEYEYDTGVTMQCSDADAAYIAAASPDAILRLLDERDALAVDARRYRFIRDADRSGHLDHELRLYAMETLDEYVDAALEDEAALDGAKE